MGQALFSLTHVHCQILLDLHYGRYSDSLRAGRSGDQIPVGGEIFRTRPDQPWDLPSLLYNGYRVFPGGKAAVAWRAHCAGGLGGLQGRCGLVQEISPLTGIR